MIEPESESESNQGFMFCFVFFVKLQKEYEEMEVDEGRESETSPVKVSLRHFFPVGFCSPGLLLKIEFFIRDFSLLVFYEII